MEELQVQYGFAEHDAARVAVVPLSLLTVGRLVIGMPLPRGSVGSRGRMCAILVVQLAGCGASYVILRGGTTGGVALCILSFCTFCFGCTSSTFAPLAIDLFGEPHVYLPVIGLALVFYGLSALVASLCVAVMGFAAFSLPVGSVACGLALALMVVATRPHAANDGKATAAD